MSQLCQCSKGFKFVDNQGTQLCSVCGALWPDSDKEIGDKANAQMSAMFKNPSTKLTGKMSVDYVEAGQPITDTTFIPIELLSYAHELYRAHMNLTWDNTFMWEQCSTEYRAAWILIAKTAMEE